jgi:quercetin dioxygenase-like cupin family protein
MHIHPHDDEVIFCVEGRGAITFEHADKVPIAAGSLVSLPAGLAHGIEAAADSRMVVIYTTSAGYSSVRAGAQDSTSSISLPGEQQAGAGA